jgi:hypothetical protein
MDKSFSAVTSGVVGAQKNRVWTGSSPGAQIAVKREDMGTLGCDGEWSVGMENVERSGEKGREVEPRPTGLPTVEPDEIDVGYVRTGSREQGDSMSQLGEPSGQPHHHALGPTIPSHWETAMEVEGDVHAAGMYRTPLGAAKRADG